MESPETLPAIAISALDALSKSREIVFATKSLSTGKIHKGTLVRSSITKRSSGASLSTASAYA